MSIEEIIHRNSNHLDTIENLVFLNIGCLLLLCLLFTLGVVIVAPMFRKMRENVAKTEELLRMTAVNADSARTHHKDTVEAAKEVKRASDEVPNKIIQKIEEVPVKTAEEVGKMLHESGSNSGINL